MKYTREDLLNAYLGWAQLQGGKRDNEWNHYCDIRDNEPLGTNADRTRRIFREITVTAEDAKAMIARIKAL